MNTLTTKLKKLKNKKGFTLIELIVVIVIIGILAAILVPKLSGFTDTAKSKAVVADAKTIITAAGAVYADTKVTPTQATIETYTGALNGTLTYSGTGDTITFTYVLDGWSVTVTDGVIGDPTEVAVGG